MMRLGPDLLANLANLPFGWQDGEYSPDGDGNVAFHDPDESTLGSGIVQGVEADKTYAIIFDLELAEGQIVALFGGFTPFSCKASGLWITTFVARSTGFGITVRASGNGDGVFGPVSLREVLDA